MKRNSFIVLSISFVLFILLAGCSQQPDIDISETLRKSEDYLRQLEEIETTASAFDGKIDIKFTLMVEGHPTAEEAIALFNKILDSFKKYSNHQNVWEYYNGYFDIKNYDIGVIYEATKVKEEELQVLSK